MADTQRMEGKWEGPDPASDSPMLWMGVGLPPRFRWVSPSLVRALGHAPEEWKAQGFVHRLVHPEDLDRVLDTWSTVARTGESRTVEFRAGAAEGRTVRLSVELNAIEPAADGAGELVGTVRLLASSLRPVRQAPPLSPEALEGLPGPAWVVDESLALQWCSPPRQEHGTEALLGAAARAADPEGWASAHRQALAGGTVGFDFTSCGRAYRCQVGPLKDAEGTIVAALGVATDVSDLDEVAQELTRAQREHEELINAVDGIVWETDASFRFTFVSKQAERLLGYPLQQWMQEPDFWLKHLYPGDQDWAPAFCMKAAVECRAHEFDYRMIAADGRVVWLRDLVTVVSEGGVFRKLRGIMVDITEQRRAQENLERTVSVLRATLDSTADGVLVVDRNRHVTAFNERFLKLWGLPDEGMLGGSTCEKLLEHTLPQLLHPERFIERVEALYTAPELEGFDTIELRDGRILERYSRPQRLGNTIIGRVWSYRDVTAERRAQEERERLLREAEEAIRVRDDFLSIASHELKTPLTPLKLHLQVLKQRGGSVQPALQHTEKALAQVARLSGLINDLLDTSRIQAGRLELRHEPVSLRELTREVLADLRPVSPQHTLEYEEPDEALTLLGDRSRLAQVLVNLLENALKYSPTGGTIRVTLERDGAHARVSVADGGIGIPADQKAHLFERFFRARNAPISGFGGLGLGLYICRDIVERHGGRIWVESEVGLGSTFHFTLPVEDGAADAHAPPAPLPGPRAV